MKSQLCTLASLANMPVSSIDARTDADSARKRWEFAYITEALREHGVLIPGCRGLGFGVGIEPLVSLFASHGAEIVATDFGSGWHGSNLDALHYPEVISKADYQSRVKWESVDMNWIPAHLANQSFDFCWSACSLDHLGSIRLSKRFIYNSLCCLKRGGIAVHTTEYNLESDWSTVDYSPTVVLTSLDVEEVLATARYRGFAPEEFDPSTDDAGIECGTKLFINNVLSTSVGLIIKRS